MGSPVVVDGREDNPFRPGAGAVPDVWVGRASLLPGHDAHRRDRVRGRYTTGTVFIGPSGIGKSVLVDRFAQRAVTAGDVVLEPVRVAKRSDPVAHLAGVVEQAARTVAGEVGLVDAFEQLLDRLQLVSVKGVAVALEREEVANPHLLVRDALVELATRIARENTTRRPAQQRAVVVRIDELQNADNTRRSALLSALGDVLEAQVELDTPAGTVMVHLPVVLYITGLPDLLNRATNVDTFRRRFQTEPLSLFEDGEVIDALLDTPLPAQVRFAEDAAVALAEIVAGDPFLFQLVGKHAWDLSDGPTITIDHVRAADEVTYRERLRVIEAASDDIPDSEARVLDAIYELAGDDLEVRAGAVASHLGAAPSQIASYAARLERRAAIRRDRGVWLVVHRLLKRYRTTGDIM